MTPADSRDVHVWLPIETAPTEGRYLIYGEWLGMPFVTEAKSPRGATLWRNIKPTHWMPLPDPPESP